MYTILAVTPPVVAGNGPVPLPTGKNKDRQSVVLLAGGIDNQLFDGIERHVLLATAELYNQRSGQFTATGSMNFGRVGHDATLLRDSRVLITGGDSNATDLPFDSAELYHPTSGTFTVTGSMTVARVGHTATLLPNGQVLVAGGQDSSFTTISSAELYDPANGTFVATGSMTVPRVGHSSTLLPDGTVLIAGGSNSIGPCPPNCALASAELYDPSTGTFSPTGSMLVQHEFHSAVLLKTGQVLIAGGGTTLDEPALEIICSGCSTQDTELYDPASRTFSETGPLITSRRGQTATLLTNGELLMTGGSDDVFSGPIPPSCCQIQTPTLLKSAELYDPASGSFVATGDMTEVRFGHSANLLANGKVLVAGGFATGANITNTADLYDPVSGSFTPTGTMLDALAEQTATSLLSSHAKRH